MDQDSISNKIYRLVKDSGFSHPELAHQLLSRFSNQIKSYQDTRGTFRNCDDIMDVDQPEVPNSLLPSSDFDTRITPGMGLDEIIASPDRLTRYMTVWERSNAHSSATRKGLGVDAPSNRSQEWQNLLKAAIPCVADHQLRAKLISSDEHGDTIIDTFEAKLNSDHLTLDRRSESKKFMDILEEALKIQDPELHRRFLDHDKAFDSRVENWSACQGMNKPQAVDPLAVLDYQTELTEEIATKIVEVYPRLEGERQSEEDGLLAKNNTTVQRDARLKWLKAEGDIMDRISWNADLLHRCYHSKDDSKKDLDVASGVIIGNGVPGSS
ncbi:hypothetical protein I302_104772 [Kwoniella bestiolae CBS 10118]|uniref:Uncharacterized protein n=1 Tax=Kwoniella bestiolae CBS 10118 TaxID=1296100 RepID=A0A1B9FRT1_9TREE|nr:hypothetical protein I302_09159 [Kwoniella bestiolae CBS 10118]OCF21480.1 hypothetical protein I302_09159 [Kwoniella bestiolae CBS 10118]